MKMLCLAILSLAFLYIYCAKDTSPLSDIPEGAFEYQGYDTSGTEIISGWLIIDLSDSNNLEGNWNLTKIGNPPNIGPQVGEGNLGGSFKNNYININLNPGIADNNVILSGVTNGNTMEGLWHFSTFVGSINGGAFKATRN